MESDAKNTNQKHDTALSTFLKLKFHVLIMSMEISSHVADRITPYHAPTNQLKIIMTYQVHRLARGDLSFSLAIPRETKVLIH